LYSALPFHPKIKANLTEISLSSKVLGMLAASCIASLFLHPIVRSFLNCSIAKWQPQYAPWSYLYPIEVLFYSCK
jgi:hypothetical protein